MLSVIITRLTGGRLIDYLRPRLFEPLGIGPAYWAGMGPYDLGFSGLHLQTDAIARLGQLYLQDGVWNGGQLLPAGWVAQASSVQVDNPREPNPDWRQGYGFQFWRCRHNGFRGDGAYGQFCVVLPDQDAVVAITAATGDMQAILDAAWAELVPNYDAEALHETADIPDGPVGCAAPRHHRRRPDRVQRGTVDGHRRIRRGVDQVVDDQRRVDRIGLDALGVRR